MVLCERHCPAVKPAVDHLRHTAHLLAALRALDCHRIDIRPVQFDIIWAVIRHFLKLGNASDRVHVPALTLPDIQRCSPVTVTADPPILNIFDPVAETPFSDTLRNPVDRIVVGNQIVAHCRHLNEPRLTGIIDQRSVAPPAMGITVLELRRVIKKAPRVQIF